jgi:hypothetical protein
MPDKNSMNKAPRKKKVADLAQLYRVGDEVNLEKAIDANDRPAIAKYLRKLSDHLSPDIVNKLADSYSLTPDKRKAYKRGPKPKKPRPGWNRAIATDYLFLCENKEIAKLFLHYNKEAFSLIEDSSIFDGAGNFVPQWKYPHSTRTREMTQLPSNADIEDFICKLYNICERNFDDLLSAYNK